MPRHITSLPLNVPPPLPGTELYRWLYDQLRGAILEGRLHPGSRLPATRDLAQAYKVSRATVVTAFEQLKSEGYVEGKTGSGTYVSEILPDDLLQIRGGREEKRLTHRGISISAYGRRLRPFRPRRAPSVRTRQPSTFFRPHSGRSLRPAVGGVPRQECWPVARRSDIFRYAKPSPTTSTPHGA